MKLVKGTPKGVARCLSLSDVEAESSSFFLLTKSTWIENQMSVSSTDDQSVNAGIEPAESEEFSSDTYTSGSKKNEESLESIKDKISKNETRVVFRLRVIVILVLLMAAGGVCAVVFLITRRAQVDAFEIQYDGVAGKVVDSFTAILTEMAAISGLGVAASAYGIDSQSSWPFVTISNFQERAGNARTLSGALFVTINPLVSGEQFDPWERYVLQDSANYWM